MAENQFDLIKKELTASNAEHGKLLALVLQELKPEEIQRLQHKAAEGQMAIELETLKKAHQFRAASADIDQFIDHIKTLEFTMRGKGSSYKATGTFTTATGQTTIEAKKGGWCFVATAVYGDTFHPDVSFLRMVRDRYLRTNLFGRRFILTYYKVGPYLANSILARGVCGKFVRAGLSAFCWVGRIVMRNKR